MAAAFDEQRFLAQQRHKLAVLLRVGLFAGAAIFPIFSVWERLIVGNEWLPVVFQIRGVSALLLLALIPFVWFPRFERWVELVLYAGATISAAGIALISLRVPHGHVHALGSLSLTIGVMLVVSTRFWSALVSLGLFITTANLVFIVGKLPHVIEVNFFVIGTAATALLLALTLERSARAAFQLELDLEDERRQLEKIAATDPLTGIDNRRSFLAKGDYVLRTAQRYERPLSLLMIDVDHFKSINDDHGHYAGDLALRSLANAVQKTIRATDIFGRLGGEEFGVLLPETDAIAATRLAERLRKQLEELEIDLSPGIIRLTVSVGVTSISSKQDTLPQLLSRSDRALYEAKHGGRNRVRVTT